MATTSNDQNGDDVMEETNRREVTFRIGDSLQLLDEDTPLCAKTEPWTLEASRKNALHAPQLLVELYELQLPQPGVRYEAEWEEMARWIRYEEDVEGVDSYWGRPHVAFLTFHSLLQLRGCLVKGALMLDVKTECYSDLCQQLVAFMTKEFKLDEDRASVLSTVLKSNHKHVPDNHLFGFGRKRSSLVVPGLMRAEKTAPDFESARRSDAKFPITSITSDPAMKRVESGKRFSALFRSDHSSLDLLKKIPAGTESAQVLVGQLPELQKVRFCMVRLVKAIPLPELLDAEVPVRFLFIILGPVVTDVDYHEIGRSVATLMANPGVFLLVGGGHQSLRDLLCSVVTCLSALKESLITQLMLATAASLAFQLVAYEARNRDQLLEGIDQFLDFSLVIPPGEIERKSLLNIDEVKKALKRRRSHRDEFETQKRASIAKEQLFAASDLHKLPYDPLRRTGRCFGGLINDVKHRLPYYWSDICDAFQFQCITSLIFMFFAAFAPAISFGGLLGDKVDGWMGSSEVLVAQCLCGVIWGLFSCQPMLIMAATGPVLVFEESLYNFCKSYKLEFMVVRVWAGFWVFILSFLTVALEGSFLVRYVTRFTEDIFATLISLIFCFESLKFLVNNFIYHPVQNLNSYCGWNDNAAFGLILGNGTGLNDLLNRTAIESMDLLTTLFSAKFDGNLVDHLLNVIGAGADATLNIVGSGALLNNTEINTSPLKINGQPDTALLSAVLLTTTFALAFGLRQLRTSFFFNRSLRKTIGDFGVPIAMFVVVLMDSQFFAQPYVQRLKMPPSFSPTNATKRGWFIPPLGMETSIPAWAIGAAFIPALLVYILIFVEIEITQLLLSTKERGLRKGGGFHYDLLLMGILTAVCSLLGLPWMCAAAVQSLAHASSLTVMKAKAPGERPEIESVIEQRITTIGVALLTGACAFCGSILKSIPLATLFGIFLYLGINNMMGVQLLQRIVLFFMHQKYHPTYCKKVRMWRMHLYTIIQLVCLAVLWVVKTLKAASLAFPFIIMLIAVLRRYILPRMFTDDELDALDGHDVASEQDEQEECDFYQEAILPV